VPEFVDLARRHGAAIVYAHHQAYPEIADVAGDFVYARLQRGSDAVETCYGPDEIARWARRLQVWAAGGQPDDLPLAASRSAPAQAQAPRDVFAYFISEGKSRAPHGAMALQDRADHLAR
jgi:uncharacterized protein YecE (DUF72 family)